jgi:hypothetical protein
MDLQEVELGGRDWIDLAQDRETWRALVNAVMDIQVPYTEGNLFTSWGTDSFLERTLLQGVSKLKS